MITFRPDLVSTMDKFFEVHYYGRYSQVRETNEPNAYRIITEALKEEERKRERVSHDSHLRASASRPLSKSQNKEQSEAKGNSPQRRKKKKSDAQNKENKRIQLISTENEEQEEDLQPKNSMLRVVLDEGEE